MNLMVEKADLTYCPASAVAGFVQKCTPALPRHGPPMISTRGTGHSSHAAHVGPPQAGNRPPPWGFGESDSTPRGTVGQLHTRAQGPAPCQAAACVAAALVLAGLHLHAMSPVKVVHPTQSYQPWMYVPHKPRVAGALAAA